MELGGIQTAAQQNWSCASSKASAEVRTSRSTDAIVDDAVRACSQERQHLLAEIRKALEPLAPSKAELDAGVKRQADKQDALLRSTLTKFVQIARRHFGVKA